MLFQTITCQLTPILWIAGKSKKMDFLICRRRLCTTKLINRSCRVRPESRNTFHYRHSAVISDKGQVIFIEIPIPYYHHSIWTSHNFFIHTKREWWSKFDEKHSFCFHSFNTRRLAKPRPTNSWFSSILLNETTLGCKRPILLHANLAYNTNFSLCWRFYPMKIFLVLFGRRDFTTARKKFCPN